MRKSSFLKIVIALLILGLFSAGLEGLFALPVQAAHFQYLTELYVDAGEGAEERLEATGYSVMMIGLNSGTSEENQVLVGYKMNTGAAITNVIVADDQGGSFTTADGIGYVKAGSGDVDYGTGIAGGCVYYTTDPAAGAPLVGLDILRADASAGEELLAITNDGAEIVRRPDGSPAELELASETVTIYLAQIREGLVKPFISEIALVTEANQAQAVYTAACHGFNYYTEGDIDDSTSTYTILAFKRTADPAQALTNVIALSADTVKKLETGETETTTEAPTETQTEEPATAEEPTAAEEPAVQEETLPAEIPPENGNEEVPAEGAQEGAEQNAEPEAGGSVSIELPTRILTAVGETDGETPVRSAEKIDISGAEYTRISSQTIMTETPCYLYATKDSKAGNPISMFYAGELTDSTEILYGTWAYGLFTAKGKSSAYGFAANEDSLEELKNNKNVYIRVPVYYLQAEGEKVIGEVVSGQPMLSLSLLTAKEGLPEERYTINGLKETSFTLPESGQNGGADASSFNNLQSTAFGQSNIWIIAVGAAIILAAIVILLVHLQREKKDAGEK